MPFYRPVHTGPLAELVSYSFAAALIASPGSSGKPDQHKIAIEQKQHLHIRAMGSIM
jgi:hypothetical protein